MNGDNGTHYPDLAPLPFGDMKEIKRLPGMQRHAPKIKWGDEYKSWPIERRLKYAEALACSMNHAADILQRERNDLIKVLKKKEQQIKQNAQAYVSQGELMHKELGNADTEKQDLYRRIVKIKQQAKKILREKEARIKELEVQVGNHD